MEKGIVGCPPGGPGEDLKRSRKGLPAFSTKGSGKGLVNLGVPRGMTKESRRRFPMFNIGAVSKPREKAQGAPGGTGEGSQGISDRMRFPVISADAVPKARQGPRKVQGVPGRVPKASKGGFRCSAS